MRREVVEKYNFILAVFVTLACELAILLVVGGYGHPQSIIIGV